MGELVAAWNAQHPEVRTFAAQALGRQAIHDPQALQLLEDALGHADPDIRLNALRGLAEAGSVADRLRPKLKRMQQQDPDQQVRTQINETLKGLDNPRSPHSAKGALWLMAVLSALGLGGYYYARKKHFEKN
jgi:HEAT repeat protein